MQPEYCKQRDPLDQTGIMVVVGICTTSAVPVLQVQKGRGGRHGADWMGGFLCPCHGSTFDFAGRVYKNKPRPDNLEVPPHCISPIRRILIGEDKKGA